MKISKEQLKRIIREEKLRVLHEKVARKNDTIRITKGQLRNIIIETILSEDDDGGDDGDDDGDDVSADDMDGPGREETDREDAEEKAADKAERAANKEKYGAQDMR